METDNKFKRCYRRFEMRQPRKNRLHNIVTGFKRIVHLPVSDDDYCPFYTDLSDLEKDLRRHERSRRRQILLRHIARAL